MQTHTGKIWKMSSLVITSDWQTHVGIFYTCPWFIYIFFFLMNIHGFFSKKKNLRNFPNKLRMIWNFHALGMWWRLAVADVIIIMLFEAVVPLAGGLPLSASPVAQGALRLGSDLSKRAV